MNSRIWRDIAISAAGTGRPMAWKNCPPMIGNPMIGNARLKIRSACVPSGINSESAATNRRRMGTGKSWLTNQPQTMMAVAAAAEVQKRCRTRP